MIRATIEAMLLKDLLFIDLKEKLPHFWSPNTMEGQIEYQNLAGLQKVHVCRGDASWIWIKLIF